MSSGHISVERDLFDVEHGVYRDDLATPAAEEYELSLRLRDRGIPIFLATRIVALHDHAVDLESMCRQAYKHSMGCAEVALKYPGTLDLHGLFEIVHVNGPANWRTRQGTAQEDVQADAVLWTTQGALLWLDEAGRAVRTAAFALKPLYKTLLSVHMLWGIRDGLRAYSGR